MRPWSRYVAAEKSQSRRKPERQCLSGVRGAGERVERGGVIPLNSVAVWCGVLVRETESGRCRR